MVITKLISFWRGYLKVKFTGGGLERFINICAKRKIYLWDISRAGSRTMTAKMSIKGYRRISEVCRKTATSAHILSKNGFPFILRRFLRRRGLVVGFISFVFIITWLCSHVWYIEIAPTELVPQSLIKEQLKVAGIYYGAPLKEINADEVQKELLNLNPKLAWVWPEVTGTKVYLDLRERYPKPEVIDKSTACNIVASHSGRITQMIVHEGREVVQKDAWVSQGELLVSGVLNSNMVGYRCVHSQADIYADVQMHLSGQYALSKVLKAPTGNLKRSVSLKFGDVKFELPVIGKQFAAYTKEEKEIPLKMGNLYFPFSIIENTYFQTQETQINYEKEKIIAEAQEYLEKTLQNEIKNGIIKERSFTSEQIDENTVEVSIDAVCNMLITQEKPIEEVTISGENNGD